MKIGILGAGVVVQTIAKHLLPFGHQITLSNSRGPDSLAELVKELGPGAIAGTPQEAAEQDLVVLAVNWPSVQRSGALVEEFRTAAGPVAAFARASVPNR